MVKKYVGVTADAFTEGTTNKFSSDSGATKNNVWHSASTTLETTTSATPVNTDVSLTLPKDGSSYLIFAGGCGQIEHVADVLYIEILNGAAQFSPRAISLLRGATGSGGAFTTGFFLATLVTLSGGGNATINLAFFNSGGIEEVKIAYKYLTAIKIATA